MMLRKIFLSILILSAFASEGGVSYSEELINYYLVNLTYFDVMQDSLNAVSDFSIKKTDTAEKKGTPAAFYKMISQDSIDSKAPNVNNGSVPLWIFSATACLAVIIVVFIYLNKKLFIFTRRDFLCLADSSPPAYCWFLFFDLSYNFIGDWFVRNMLGIAYIALKSKFLVFMYLLLNIWIYIYKSLKLCVD